MLQAPAELSLVRAPTDNDLGGSDGTSHAARWLSLGLDRELVPKSCTVTVKDASDSSVTIQARPATTCQNNTLAWSIERIGNVRPLNIVMKEL